MNSKLSFNTLLSRYTKKRGNEQLETKTQDGEILENLKRKKYLDRSKDLIAIIAMQIESSHFLSLNLSSLITTFKDDIEHLDGIVFDESDINSSYLLISVCSSISLLRFCRFLTTKRFIGKGYSLQFGGLWLINQVNQEIETDSKLLLSGSSHLHDLVFPQLTIMYPLKSIEYRKHTRDIVISRYCEDISWIPTDWHKDVILYNKGSSLLPPAIENDQTRPIKATTPLEKESSIAATPSSELLYKELIQLENVGRESHTYLTYIITHYHDLPDCIYFLQANPFDHSPIIMELIHNNIGIIHSYFPLGHEVHYIHDLNVSKYEKQFPGIQSAFERTVQELFKEEIERVDKDDSEKNNNRNIRKPVIKFSPGAIFAVKGETIRLRPIEFYEKAIKLVDWNINPMEGHAFERLWSYIFQCKNWI